jgi:hypothetical protein
MDAVVWESLKKKELVRAFEFYMKIRHINTIEEFEKVWYSEDSDKKGEHHLSNMCMSIFQARKSNAGKTFERYNELLYTEQGILFLKQCHVDDAGKIYNKKPKVSSHKVDYIIQHVPSSLATDSTVVSAKKTFRERWRQDLCHIGKCKKLIYVTNERPSQTLIDSITGYDTVLVFPDAPSTERTWSFNEYISRLKQFKETGSYSLA